MKTNKLKLAILAILAVGAITLWASGVKADQVIYSQPLQSPLVDAGGLYTTTGSFQTADTFTLTQGASIDSIQWFGSYENDNTVGFPTPTAIDFVPVLGICHASDCLSNGDFDDLPGFSLMTVFTVRGARDLPRDFECIRPIRRRSIYSSNYGYQVNFSVPLQLSSGTYFLSIFPELATGIRTGRLMRAQAETEFHRAPTQPCADNFDLAFTLNGTPTANVPEPSSLLLLAVGLGDYLLALRACAAGPIRGASSGSTRACLLAGGHPRRYAHSRWRQY